MDKRVISFILTLLLLALAGALVLALAGDQVQAQAGSGVLRVAPSGSDVTGCGGEANPCQTIQYAVDQAADGDEVWIATFDVLLGIPPVTTTARYVGSGASVVALDKSLTLRGGYIYAHSTVPPLNFWRAGVLPALLDGERARRVVSIQGPVTPTLELLALVNGQANRGGDLYAEDATLSLVATPVLSGSADYGGGLYLKDCRVSFDPGDLDWQSLFGVSGLVLIRGNSAQYGGGLYIEGGRPALTGLGVLSNTASADGGGLYLQEGHPTLAGGLIRGNRAANRGGGLFLADSAARIAATAVYSNTAAEGAGLYLDGPLTLNPLDLPLIANNYVRYNRATGGLGGGLYLREAIAGLVNNVIADNQAAEGAGLYLWASSPQVFHNTIAQNAGGSGLYLTHAPGSVWPPLPPVPSWPSITNTIVASQTVGVYVDSTGLPYPLENRASLDGTLWWANGSDAAGPGQVVRNHDVNGNPRFTCTGTLPGCLNPYHILTDSAAVDAGVIVALSLPGTDQFVDIDGQLRPSGEGYDIGADEIVSETYSVWLLPPLSVQPAQPGETVTHTHRLLNTGLQTDTYDLRIHSDSGWATLLTAGPITLSAQSSATVQVRVDVPASASAGMSDTTVITATSRAEVDRRALALDITRIPGGDTADLILGERAEPAVLTPGGAVRYSLVVTNAGPLTQSLPVTLTSATAPTRAIGAWSLPAGCTGDVNRGLFTCTLTLPGGAVPVSRSLGLVLTTTGTYSGLLVSGAGVAPPPGVTDPNPLNNAAQATVLVTDCLPLRAVGISGPSEGVSGTSSVLTAVLTPAQATAPVTYTWSPVPAQGQNTSQATYTWTVTGTQVITLVVENCGGLVSDTHAITIAESGEIKRNIYLPLVLKESGG